MVHVTNQADGLGMEISVLKRQYADLVCRGIPDLDNAGEVVAVLAEDVSDDGSVVISVDNNEIAREVFDFAQELVGRMVAVVDSKKNTDVSTQPLLSGSQTADIIEPEETRQRFSPLLASMLASGDRTRRDINYIFEGCMNDRQIVGIINYLCNRYFPPPGNDKEDLRQLGLIGLYKAVRDYDSSKGASFPYFARFCMSREMTTFINAGNRKKDRPLNDAVFSHKSDDEGSSNFDIENLTGGLAACDLSTVLMNYERMRTIFEILVKNLSELERMCIIGIASGFRYDEVAANNGLSMSTVDNAVQRARKKLRAELARYDYPSGG